MPPSASAALLAVACAGVLAAGWFFLPRSAPLSTAAEPPAEPRKRDQFAEDRAAGPRPAAFDGDRAMGYLRQLCALGPRVSGSEAMAKQQELLARHFEAHGGRVQWQRFNATQRSRQRPVEMANLIASWKPDAVRRVIFCGHYDTRPIADQEPDRRDWAKPFVSANDGTSTVAWMMELAHHVKDLDLSVGLDFVIFDGEEYVFKPDGDRYFFGSDHFGTAYRKEKPPFEYTAAILLDLFAGKEPAYPVEQNSAWAAGKLVEEVWAVAAELKVGAFRNTWGPEVQDDHLALNRAGIPAIDVIDFNYRHWHRLSDTPENCSGASMKAVSDVLTVWAQRQK